MAHDSQLPQELQEPKSESLKPTNKQSESLAVLADWWQVYGQIYRDDPTEMLAVAFRETLQDLAPATLHAACLKAQRESPQFRPTPGRIYELAQYEGAKNAKGNRPAYLDEPVLSPEEREAELSSPEYQQIREKIFSTTKIGT